MTLYDYCLYRASNPVSGSRQENLELRIARSTALQSMTAVQIMDVVICRHGRKGREYTALKRLVAAYRRHCKIHGIESENVSLRAVRR